MSVVKGTVNIYKGEERLPVGTGSCTLMIRADGSSGTISMREWAAPPQEINPLDDPYQEGCLIQFQDGRTAPVEFTKHTATGCGPDILRFTLRGPLRP
ncbi:MAG: hypothetical protein HW403_310 [Dehalococcoidia bacterium]|nr:hypothetical protein [Dehalococcoidia bacterium]